MRRHTIMQFIDAPGIHPDWMPANKRAKGQTNAKWCLRDRCNGSRAHVRLTRHEKRKVKFQLRAQARKRPADAQDLADLAAHFSPQP